MTPREAEQPSLAELARRARPAPAPAERLRLEGGGYRTPPRRSAALPDVPAALPDVPVRTFPLLEAPWRHEQRIAGRILVVLAVAWVLAIAWALQPWWFLIGLHALIMVGSARLRHALDAWARERARPRPLRGAWR